MALIQDRMPVIIERDDWAVWLGEAEGDPQALMHALPSDRFRVWPVSRAVNSVNNEGPELLEPVQETEVEAEQAAEPTLL